MTRLKSTVLPIVHPMAATEPPELLHHRYAAAMTVSLVPCTSMREYTLAKETDVGTLLVTNTYIHLTSYLARFVPAVHGL